MSLGQNKVLWHLKDCNKIGSQQHKTRNVWPKIRKRDWPGGPVVRTSSSNAGHSGSIPGEEATEIFFFMVHIKKKNLKKKKLQRSRKIWFTTIVTVQLLHHAWLFAIPWTAGHQASLSWLQQPRLPCPSLSPRVYSNSCPWKRSVIAIDLEMTKRVKWLTRAVKQPVRDLYMQGIRGKHECEKERSGKFSEDTTELLKLKHISITSEMKTTCMRIAAA